MTDVDVKGDKAFQFPQGQRSDKFLISTPSGPAYLLTRGDLEDASQLYMSELMKAHADFTSRAPTLNVDLAIGIKESAKIWPFNR